MRICISWNDGTIRNTIEPSTNIAAGMAKSRMIESCTLSRTARIVPITRVSGAAIIMVVAITTTSCTCCTSLVMRVISDGAPKWPTSRAE